MRRRQQIFYDPSSGVEVMLPVTPGSWQWTEGNAVYATSIEGFGGVHFGGDPTVTTETITSFFPRRRTNLCEADASLDPDYYIKIFTDWARRGTVLRYIVAETTINRPVIIASFSLGESGGSGNVTYTMTIKESPPLPPPSKLTEETGVGADREPPVASTTVSYTVVSGDTLWALCRRFYGETSQSLCGRVAAHNGLTNPSLILIGQTLEFPPMDGLTAKEVPITNVAQKKVTEVTPVSDLVSEDTSVLKRSTETVQINIGATSQPVKVSYTTDTGAHTSQTMSKGGVITMKKYCICNIYIGYPAGQNITILVDGKPSTTVGSAVFSASDGIHVTFKGAST